LQTYRQAVQPEDSLFGLRPVQMVRSAGIISIPLRTLCSESGLYRSTMARPLPNRCLANEKQSLRSNKCKKGWAVSSNVFWPVATYFVVVIMVIAAMLAPPAVLGERHWHKM